MYIYQAVGKVWEGCFTTSLPKAIREIEKFCWTRFDFPFEIREENNHVPINTSLYKEIKTFSIIDIEKETEHSQFIIFRVTVI